VTIPGTGPPGPVRVNVPAFSVAGFIGSLNVAETTALTRTPVARLAGTVEITVGGPVVNVHTKFAARGLPPGSVAPVVIVAVYRVKAASEAVGVKVAVEPEYVTAPATAVTPGPISVNVVVLIVAGAITELKVAVTTVLRRMGGAPSRGAPFTGDVAITVGNAGLEACSRPHPPERATNTNASEDIFPILNLRISFSCSTGDKAFLFRFFGRLTCESLNLSK